MMFGTKWIYVSFIRWFKLYSKILYLVENLGHYILKVLNLIENLGCYRSFEIHDD